MHARFIYHGAARSHQNTLSLHDALPIFVLNTIEANMRTEELLKQSQILFAEAQEDLRLLQQLFGDRKSTRLNSSHLGISYAVFCLKKKNLEMLRHVDAVLTRICFYDVVR